MAPETMLKMQRVEGGILGFMGGTQLMWGTYGLWGDTPTRENPGLALVEYN